MIRPLINQYETAPEVESPETPLPTWESLPEKVRDAIEEKVMDALVDVCADLLADNAHPIRTSSFTRIRDTVNRVREEGMYQAWCNQEVAAVAPEDEEDGDRWDGQD